MQIQDINISRSAKYYTVGTLTKKTKYIWFALHGYGQTAYAIAAKFEYLDPEDHFIICPEGLNKFYWHSNNRPVACWMTKMHRYDEINDFVGFLDQLYNKYCKHVNQNVIINFFAFSQGCATVWRWIHASQPRFNNLVNWAGWIPEDIVYLQLKNYLGGKKIFLHYGSEDEFITTKAMQGIQEVIEKNDLKVAISQFNGGHRIPNESLVEFIKTDLGVQ